MTTKEKILEHIDKLQKTELKKVYKLLVEIDKKKKGKTKIKSYSLGTKLDKLDLRKSAYE
jgi:hypothetical protein